MSTSTTSVSTKVLFSVAIGLAVSIFAFYTLKRKKNRIPKKWRRIGNLEQINLFPIKSCAPLKLSEETELECEILGLRYDNIQDRALMIINDDNEMITGRVYPKMVLIQFQKMGPSKLIISAPEMKNIELDLATFPEFSDENTVHTAVWSTKLKAMHCGAQYDQWFSKYILKKENGLRLVYYPYTKPVRTINPRMHKERYITRQDTGTFNDATSYMLMNLSSIRHLNIRLPEPINPVYPLQFRGNFHLNMDNDVPYAEDKWGWIKIGDDAIFRVVAPCTRCIFPNVNPYTGGRNPENEPAKTLGKYRLFNDYPTPVLGIHLGLRQRGTVKVNDVIYIEDES